MRDVGFDGPSTLGVEDELSMHINGHKLTIINRRRQ